MRRPKSRGWSSAVARGGGRLLFFSLWLAAPSRSVVAADLAYVANLRAATVSIVDVESRTVTGRISVGADPNGLVLSPTADRLFVTNFAGNSLSMIDTTTRTVVATIPLGLGPVGLATTPNGAEVYTANKTANSVSVGRPGAA